MSTTLRPFDWRDLPALHRYRAQGVFLDSALALTRGDRLSPWALISSLAPSTGVYTWVCSGECDDQPLMGQVAHTAEAPFARLSFLAPETALESPSITGLLEQLAYQAGEHGALHLLAEIDEQSAAFEALRTAGFGVYARQKIWRLSHNGDDPKPEIPWETASSHDAFAAQSLYHNVVPGLVQQIEPLPVKQIQGFVCEYNGQLIGYVNLKYGNRGIWAQPFIHPDVTPVEARLRDMVQSIPDRRPRPLYICVRTYQSWLEPALEALGAEPGPSQAVLVKRLAVQQRVSRPFALPKVEGQPEVSAPIARSKQNS